MFSVSKIVAGQAEQRRNVEWCPSLMVAAARQAEHVRLNLGTLRCALMRGSEHSNLFKSL
eukprot:2616945-Amphidinium_carterae.1